MLELRNIHYSVGGKEILKGIDLRVEKGRIHSIIGVNGTGKTTLAAILMGLNGYMPNSGTLFFNGRDITSISTTERAKLGITLAWQIPANFEGITVRDYLGLGSSGMKPEQGMRLAGLNPRLYLDREIDDNLSGGERKRIEIASVYCMRPKLVILDEPDSGIDMASIDVLKKMIKRFKDAGASVLLITHSERMAAIADEASILCSGRIVKRGTPEKVTAFFKRHCDNCTHRGEIEEGILNDD